MTAPFSREIRYGRDAFGQLDTLVAIDGSETTRHYNADRQGIQVRYPTGDTLFRRFASTHRAGLFNWSSTELRGAFYTSYELDERSRVKSRRLGALDTLRYYGYDGADRLTSVEDSVVDLLTAECSWEADSGNTCGSENTTLARSRTYGYDGVGNRTDSGAELEAGNRLVAFDGYTLSWDSAGHLVSKSGNGLDQSFHWSATGRLDSVVTDGTVTRYRYDGFGRRIEVSEGGVTRAYVHDGEDLLLELDGSGGLVAEYTPYPGTDRPHSMRRGGATYYYATDELGTVRGLFDGAGGVVSEYRYEPFGQPSAVSEGVESPYRFTGRVWDAGPELYHYRARYYDPDLARFISEDPIGLAGGINPYAYVGNNPVNATDPSGLGECWRTLTGGYVCEPVGVTVDSSPEEENTSGDTGAGDQFPTVPGRDGGPGGGGPKSPDGNDKVVGEESFVDCFRRETGERFKQTNEFLFRPAAKAVGGAAKLGLVALYNNRRQSVGIFMSGWAWAQSGGQAFLGMYGGGVFAGAAGVGAGVAAGAEASLAITTMFEIGVGLGSAGGAAVACL